MKFIIIIFCGLLSIVSFANNCDNCQVDRYGISVHLHYSTTHPSLIYCGNNYGYISRYHYDLLHHYIFLNQNSVLKINGEFIDGPCILANR